jgi:predicted metal-dependent hydrolase
LRLVVRPGLIELVTPDGMPEAKALGFLAEHRQWAEAKAREFHRKSKAEPKPSGFCDLPSLPWQGLELPLLIQEDACRRVSMKVDDAIRIVLPQDLGNNRDRAAKRALFMWMRKWMAQRVTTLAQHHGHAAGLVARHVRIKSMKTRWGSCGPRNDININWLLALAPAEVLEYVVIHELCHIRERNHAPAFWALVGQYCPDYLRHRQWLRTHGPSLMRRFSVDE